MAKATRRTRDEDDEDDDRPRRSRGRDDDDIPPGTPRVYVHQKCGGKTKMPADVVRTYLDNPFHFGHQTYCDHCEKDVPWKNCTWAETGENLLDYFEDMQARALLAGDDPRQDEEGKGAALVAPVVGLIFGAVAGAVSAKKFGTSPVVAGLIGGVLGLGLGLVQWYRTRQEFGRTKEEYDRQLFKRFYARHPEEKPGKKRKQRDDDD